ncbi:MAG: helix-turn-helix transcriptional regulator [Saezia sp.]
MRNLSNIILQSKERCILRMPEVERRTGFKRAHIYKLIRNGKFPHNTKIGSRSVGWDSEDIDQWIEEQLKKA